MIVARSKDNLVVRLLDGESLMDHLLEIETGSAIIVCGIGMVRDAELGYWNGESYEIHRVPEPCELLAMQGNIGSRDGETIVHAHLTLARKDGSVVGGHLVRATVANTAEIAVRQIHGILLRRKPDPNGLIGLYPEVRGDQGQQKDSVYSKRVPG